MVLGDPIVLPTVVVRDDEASAEQVCYGKLVQLLEATYLVHSDRF